MLKEKVCKKVEQLQGRPALIACVIAKKDQGDLQCHVVKSTFVFRKSVAENVAVIKEKAWSWIIHFFIWNFKIEFRLCNASD